MTSRNTDRVLRTVSTDGTDIVARVVGSGAPTTVFLPAGPGASEASWRHVVPHLAERSTCAVPPVDAVLSRIAQPVLLLCGVQSNRWFADSVNVLENRLRHATVSQVDAAHFGPYTAPQQVVRAIGAYFSGSVNRRC